MPSAHFRNVLNLFSSSVQVGRYGLRDAQQITAMLIGDELVDRLLLRETQTKTDRVSFCESEWLQNMRPLTCTC